MNKDLIIRPAKDTDRQFIFGLSPRLAEVAALSWHSDKTLQKMHDDYFAEVFANSSPLQATFIAEQNEIALGFIHTRAHKDEISNEACGTVPLLGVSPKAQGLGVGKALITAAEQWAKQQGYRLLHLEVFANNNKALGFYQNLGFESETLHMIKKL
ncbi:GNAT family N-acetyltransferase [Colwellia psychrerythraea]|uniref:GCN5-related N-acetyltransferase n=1 Tax=Colwellia psychrerythraea TaxID=28229 RepID=A0A099KJE6_COLPS|nr:GNAT family N-acetyltransferase [Colwellia psychrerythraea]KGJ90954.1 GCN5-related N-acetyltransferase [Colwellia psychrerythraea]